jgi:hypothetical protein
MRKAIGFNVTVLVIAMVFTTGTAFAGKAATGNAAPSGPHWNINIIGHPKGGIGGDDSSGHSIMIPLRNTQTAPLICTDLQDVNGVQVTPTNPIAPYEGNYEPTGAKIYFRLGDHFEILDRDATDGNGATIMVPVDYNSTTHEAVVKFDVYIRVLGKPNQCMKINTFFYDSYNQLWLQTGTVSVYRTKGKSTFVTANELFTICEWTATGCSNVLSAFDNGFQSYFWLWDVNNNGTRLLQMRLYPK